MCPLFLLGMPRCTGDLSRQDIGTWYCLPHPLSSRKLNALLITQGHTNAKG